MTGSLSVIGFGISAVGSAIGVALIFSAWISSTARQPESAGLTRPMMFVGAALAPPRPLGSTHEHRSR